MNLFIPTIGTLITLEKDWEFELNSNYRNYTFWQFAFPDENANNPTGMSRYRTVGNTFYNKPSRKFALLRGSILKIENITINRAVSRNGIVFTLRHDARGEITRKLRLYASLSDANRIICEVDNKP